MLFVMASAAVLFLILASREVSSLLFCIGPLIICAILVIVFKREWLTQKLKEWASPGNFVSLVLWGLLITQDFSFFARTTTVNTFGAIILIAATYWAIGFASIFLGGFGFGALLDMLFPRIAERQLRSQGVAAWLDNPETTQWENDRYGIRKPHKKRIVAGAQIGTLICMALLLLIKFLVQTGAIIL